MLTGMVDAFEGRKVVTVDIKGAFRKAEVPEGMELVVKMTGDLSTLMCSLNPTWKSDENGVLYLKYIKALYGHIEAAKLFYNDLNHTLIDVMRFVQNRYDPCVYNKMTSDGQVTVRVSKVQNIC
jgi:hypothetical protein